MKDADIRPVLQRHVEQRYGTRPDTEIVNEFGVRHGTNRIDLAVVNGVMRGYEIKSAKDTLERLPAQSAMYATVFDYLTLVASPKHIEPALPMLPDWWGIVRADPAPPKAKTAVRLTPVRRAKRNPAVDPEALVALLWRDEAYDALAARGLAAEFKHATRPVLWQALLDELSLKELQAVVRTSICSRAQRVLSDPWAF
ncbi:sce7726 family protein [Deinococcus multiflagellatus]|uniref:Sce7726 family protein n=1 Tax=Deinococcus multiflagellatus TaxID=1656887 RepID=A0ABW1ZRF0_9DEIO|nr:sce7726 family protein [Deinococcus multiflagellatus]MBZ9715554.1 sce7726 family protein [Deinococcus multiflagellatus]